MNHEAKPADNKENPTRDEARAANSGAYAPRGFTKRLTDATHNPFVRVGLAGAQQQLLLIKFPQSVSLSILWEAKLQKDGILSLSPM